MQDPRLKAWRDDFLEAHFGKPRLVLHPVLSEFPHVDVNIYDPDENGRPYSTLVTDGLSDLLLERPHPTAWACDRAELVMYLPDLTLAPGQTEFPWAVKLLRKVAQLPVQTDFRPEAFLALPNGVPPRPFSPGSRLTHSVLLPARAEPAEVRDGLDAPDGTNVEFLWLDFATTAEAELLAARGPADYLALLDSAEHQPASPVLRDCYVEGRNELPSAIDLASNVVRQLETRTFEGDGADVHVIFVALDVDDPASADAFVAGLVGKVCLQRMMSPPDTEMMLFTIVGDLDAQAFANLWRKHAARNASMNHFMSRMVKVDIVQGTRAGVKLSECALQDSK